MTEIPAQQRQITGPGVVDVGCDIHEILPKPPAGHRGAKGIAGLQQQSTGADQGHEQLAQGAAQRCHEGPEGPEQEVTGLMEGQIDQMQEGLAGAIAGRGQGHEAQPPQQQDQQEGGARPPTQPIKVGLTG